MLYLILPILPPTDNSIPSAPAKKFEIILSDFGLFLMSNCFCGKTSAVEIAVKPAILKDRTKITENWLVIGAIRHYTGN